MAVQKNFVIRNGIEVNNNLLIADTSTDHVGIGTSTPKNKLEVIGGIGATHINILGISTVVTEFNVGSGGTVITSLDTGLTGFGTASPAYILDIRSPVSTGQTALYVQGDARITGDLYLDDVNLDQATVNNIEVTGVGTIATASIDLGYTNLGIVTSLITTGIASISTGIITTLSGTSLNYTGIGTITNFNSTTSNIATIDNSNLRVSGIASINTGVVTTAYINTGIITTLSGSNLTYSGIGTINTASVDLAYVKTGIVTNLTTSGIATIATASVDLSHTKTGIVTNLTTSGIGTINTASVDLAYVKTGIVTNLTTSGIASITTGVVNNAYVNTGIVTTLSGSNLDYSGIGSFGSINTPTARIVTGIVTTIDNTNLTVSGIASITNGVVNTAYVNTGIITTLSGSNLSYSGIGTITTASVDLAYVNTGIVTNLTTTGIASIATGVITSAYINTGIVTTLSSTNLTVSGLTTTNTLAVNTGFDVYASDSTFHGSVTIEGNLSIGGTSTVINVGELRVEDKDIIVGFTTSQTPTDDTANHGGIAVASTEGTPLVSLFAAGINTLPDTYKQMMWVKNNTMGAGTTDAFLFNYGVGIGSTQVPNGVRLAVGSVQITDNQVNTTNLNATGVGTINTISAVSADITNLSISGIITSGGYNVGIQSGGLDITTGVITALNFIGAGNTFSYNAGTKIVDINIGGSQWTFADQANPTTSSIYRVDGNVGIGTTNPAEKLTVVGDTLLSGDVGINTTSIDNPNLTGVGNSFNGVYIANGMIIVDNTLEGDHYIGTSYNGLMAGPVTINGILTVDGNYVVV